MVENLPIKSPRCYNIPLKLVSRSYWRRINHPARAILPVLGLHADDNGKCWPGIKLISKLSGYTNFRHIRSGINSLKETGLLVKEKEGRKNIYYLTDKALCMGGSYFPMKEYLFIKNWWGKLLPSEKAVFIVLAVKGAIADPDIPPEFDEEEVHAHGTIQPIKWLKLTGISRQSWYNALYGLNHKHWIGLAEYNAYVIYK